MEMTIGLTRIWEQIFRPIQQILSRKKSNTAQLKHLLDHLDKIDDPTRIKGEEKRFLTSISSRDLVLALKKLLKRGVDQAKLQKFCSLYSDLVDDRTMTLRKTLPAGHVIKTLIDEHETILCFLDDLDFVNQSIQVLKRYDPHRVEFRRLAHIARQLNNIEPHHKREEYILLPQLENRGLYGLPMPMHDEHEQIRQYKQKLLELAENVEQMDYKDFASQLDGVVRFLVPTFQDHIFRINNIMFPAALDAIDDPQSWSRLKAECDKIGYCTFAPTE